MIIDKKILIGIPSALVATGVIAAAMWNWLDVAKGSDVRSLRRDQVDSAIQIYSNTRRQLLYSEPKEVGTTAHKAWEEDLNDAREKLRNLNQRKIELTK